MVELCRNNTNGILICNEIYTQVCCILKDISLDYEIEANELCCKFLKVDKAFLRFSQEIIKEEDCIALQNAIQSRVKGIPLQYILGEWEFYGEKFLVGEGVLIPRADTETLIDSISTSEYVQNFVDNSNKFSVLDICSGSGCIAITLERVLQKKLQCSTLEVTAIEKSEDAYVYLKKNIELHNSKVKVLLEDALKLDKIKLGMYDIIVSNPPYIEKEEISNLQKEVQYEPKMALDGGEDGLYFYRELTKKYTKFLKSGGTLYYEIGIGQENDVKNIFLENNLYNVCFCQDMCGIIRVVSATKY